MVLIVAMLEMVATHPEYRHRGLVRAQIRRFHEVVRERGFDLSLIEGIPYYYRQYGYGYAIDHWACDSLPTRCILDRRDAQESPYRLHQATVAPAKRGPSPGNSRAELPGNRHGRVGPAPAVHRRLPGLG